VRTDRLPQPRPAQHFLGAAPVRCMGGVGDREAPEPPGTQGCDDTREVHVERQGPARRSDQREPPERVQRAAPLREPRLLQLLHVGLVRGEVQRERGAAADLRRKRAGRTEAQPQGPAAGAAPGGRDLAEHHAEVRRRRDARPPAVRRPPPRPGREGPRDGAQGGDAERTADRIHRGRHSVRRGLCPRRRCIRPYYTQRAPAEPQRCRKYNLCE
jgi:hypothetical protein